MYFKWHEFYVTALLSLSTLNYAAPPPAHGALVARQAGVTATSPQASDAPLPPELQPQPEDDHLKNEKPPSDLKDAAFDDSDFSDLPDYDPDQNGDGGENKLRKRFPKQGGTNLLREIRPQGLRVRPRFLAFKDKKSLFVKWKDGKTGKDKAVSIYETNDELPVPEDKKNKPELVWQADHVPDLGLFTTLARKKKPDNIAEKAWQLFTSGVLGDDADSDKPKANTRTQTLGFILNDVVGIRGIFTSWNRNKMEVMNAAYGAKDIDLKKVFKKYSRSSVWGTYKMLVKTEDQFKESVSKVAAAAKGFVKDDDTSATNLEKYIIDDVTKMRGSAIKSYEDVLKSAPPEDVKDSPFKVDDCSNTKDSPDVAPDDDTQQTTTPAEGCTAGGFALTKSDCEKNCAGGTCSTFTVQGTTTVTTYWGCKC